MIFAVLVLFFLNSQYVCPFPCGCLVDRIESLVFRGPRCLVFVQLDPDHPGSPPFWNKVYVTQNLCHENRLHGSTIHLLEIKVVKNVKRNIHVHVLMFL